LVGGAIALIVSGVVLHLLGVAGYRTGFVGVFLPIALTTGAAVWVGGRAGGSRPIWIAAGVVAAAIVAGLLAEAARPSKGRLLAEARSYVPPFYEEVAAATAGHSWCRPDCPSARVTLATPNVGTRGVMLAIITELYTRGIVDRRAVDELSRSRDFTVVTDGVRYDVELEGEGDDRTLVLTLAAV
jgi:hypothetical protein